MVGDKAWASPMSTLSTAGNALLTSNNDAAVREKIVEKGTLAATLDVLSEVMGVKPRLEVEPAPEPEEGAEAEKKPEEKEAEKEAAGDGDEDEDGDEPQGMRDERTGKAKGTGYGDVDGETHDWVGKNDGAQGEKDEVASAQLAFLAAFLTPPASKGGGCGAGAWQPDAQLCEQLLRSALLPVMEDSLRADSFANVCKRASYYTALVALIDGLSRHEALAGLLAPLQGNWEPRQGKSVGELLDSMAQTAKVFLGCLGADSKKGEKDNEAARQVALAKSIKKINKSVKKQLANWLKRAKAGGAVAEEEELDYVGLMQPLVYGQLDMGKGLGPLLFWGRAGNRLLLTRIDWFG